MISLADGDKELWAEEHEIVFSYTSSIIVYRFYRLDYEDTQWMDNDTGEPAESSLKVENLPPRWQYRILKQIL